MVHGGNEHGGALVAALLLEHVDGFLVDVYAADGLLLGLQGLLNVLGCSGVALGLGGSCGDAADHGVICVGPGLIAQDGLFRGCEVGEGEGVGIVAGIAVLRGGEEIGIVGGDWVDGDGTRVGTCEESIEAQGGEGVAAVLAEGDLHVGIC